MQKMRERTMETDRAAPLYCGDPPMTISRLLRQEADGGLSALFDGRRVFWSFNARVAIRAACDILGFQPGDEVLAPAYNCGSDLDPLVHAGVTVRLFPVGPDLRLDPERIEPLITERTRALYVIHYFGMIQPDPAALRKLCDRHGLRMIEDCALSLLSGRAPVEGRTGDVSVFCFYKFFPVLAGGALVINAPDLTVESPFPYPAPRRMVVKTLARAALANVLGPARAQNVIRVARRTWKNDGPNRSEDEGLADIPAHYYFDPALRGTRISLFAARPLRAFAVPEVIAARRANWSRYRDLLVDVPEIRMLMPELSAETCPLNMPVMVAERDRVAQALQARGISATPWWAGFNRNLDWRGQPEAIALKNGVLSLPLHQFLGAAHLDYIVAQLREVLSAEQIRPAGA